LFSFAKPEVAIGSLNALLGANSDRRVPEETEHASLTQVQEKSPPIEAEAWERAEEEPHLLEDERGDATLLESSLIGQIFNHLFSS